MIDASEIVSEQIWSAVGCALVAGLLLGLFVGCAVAWKLDSAWEKECGERGAAHYDAQTGEWRWNEAKP